METFSEFCKQCCVTTGRRGIYEGVNPNCSECCSNFNTVAIIIRIESRSTRWYTGFFLCVVCLQKYLFFLFGMYSLNVDQYLSWFPHLCGCTFSMNKKDKSWANENANKQQFMTLYVTHLFCFQ
jgi:hypothetical protein